jgi:hypothetical protein
MQKASLAQMEITLGRYMKMRISRRNKTIMSFIPNNSYILNIIVVQYIKFTLSGVSLV